MDPDAVLARLRGLAIEAGALASDDPEAPCAIDEIDAVIEAFITIAEGFVALDTWLTVGGHLPREWAR